MEFIFREGHIKLWYTGRQCRKLIMAPEKLEFPSTIRQIVIYCGTNNIEENSPNDIANGLLCSALIIKKGTALQIYTSLVFYTVISEKPAREIRSKK